MIVKKVTMLDKSFVALHDKIRLEAVKLSAKKDDERQLYAIALFSSIVEHVNGVHRLTKHSPNVSVLVLRGTLELYIHLKLTEKRPDYHETRELSLLKTKSVRLQNNKNYPYYPELTNTEAGKEKERIDLKIKSFLDRGVVPLEKWSARFTEAGIKNEYCFYQRLCDHAHSDIQTLRDRHLTDNSAIDEVRMFQPLNSFDQSEVLMHTAKIFMESIILLASTLDQKDRVDLSSVEAEYLNFMSIFGR